MNALALGPNQPARTLHHRQHDISCWRSRWRRRSCTASSASDRSRIGPSPARRRSRCPVSLAWPWTCGGVPARCSFNGHKPFCDRRIFHRSSRSHHCTARADSLPLQIARFRPPRRPPPASRALPSVCAHGAAHGAHAQAVQPLRSSATVAPLGPKVPVVRRAAAGGGQRTGGACLQHDRAAREPRVGRAADQRRVLRRHARRHRAEQLDRPAGAPRLPRPRDLHHARRRAREKVRAPERADLHPHHPPPAPPTPGVAPAVRRGPRMRRA
jgi:hypothetical protein